MVKKTLRHFVDLFSIDSPTILQILNLAHKIKEVDSYSEKLRKKVLTMIFEKPSTRTRLSFEIGMKQLGGDVVTLDQADTQLGRGESIQDTIKVISQYADIIMYRGSDQNRLDKIVGVAEVPIINGLTDTNHPCQIMADILTLQEVFTSLEKINISWIGDGNNVCNSWIEVCKHFNFNLTVCTPSEFKPNLKTLEKVKKLGKNVNYTHNPKKAALNANVIITDTWLSMGDKETSSRKDIFKSFQVNSSLMKLTNSNSFFMHCMPAHRGQEVTDEVIDGKKSLVFEEAHNRLHIQKAILLWCLNKEFN
tara:strand:- start:4619 stop:5539 length:921 start_codon:yes stop_codon:yes gene_type:complete